MPPTAPRSTLCTPKFSRTASKPSIRPPYCASRMAITASASRTRKAATSPSSAASSDHTDAADQPDRPRKLSHVNINSGDSEATFALLSRRARLHAYRHHAAAALSVLQTDHHSMVLVSPAEHAQSHRVRRCPISNGDARRRPHARRGPWRSNGDRAVTGRATTRSAISSDPRTCRGIHRRDAAGRR